MFTMIRLIPVRRLFSEQLPALTLSLIIAELFYQFHSFLLETGAFLLTWFAVDALIQAARAVIQHVSARDGT
jgi:hypothetical protein